MMAFVFSISREREYIADADSEQAMGSGEPLASALSKIEYVYQQGQTCDPPPGVEAFCIAGHWSLPALGATHPSTQDRVNRLMDNSHQNVVDPHDEDKDS
jgi:heat shock protein HtpX